MKEEMGGDKGWGKEEEVGRKEGGEEGRSPRARQWGARGVGALPPPRTLYQHAFPGASPS